MTSYSCLKRHNILCIVCISMSLVLAVPTNHRKGDHEKKSEKLAENVVSSSKDEMRSSEDESKETKFGMFVVQPNSEGTYEKRLSDKKCLFSYTTGEGSEETWIIDLPRGSKTVKGDSPWACVVSVRGHSSNLHFDHFSLQAVGMTSTFGATLQDENKLELGPAEFVYNRTKLIVRDGPHFDNGLSMVSLYGNTSPEKTDL